MATNDVYSLTPNLANRSLTGAPPALDPTLGKEAADVAVSKVASVSGASSMAGAASALPRSLESDDAVQVGADVLKLTGEALSKTTDQAGSTVLVGANAITSVNKALQGDAYAATSAATAAIEKSATLSSSPVAAVANIALAAVSKDKVAETHDQLKVAAHDALDPHASGAVRTKAFFDMGLKLQQLALLYRTIGNSLFKGGKFLLTQLAKVKHFGPAVAKLETQGAAMAATPFGKALGFANKWIPLLNVAGLVMSGKTAIDVFRDSNSSKTSKVLAAASVATAGLCVAAGVTLGGWALAGVIAGSVAIDLSLANARNRDQTTRDTDKVMANYLEHPGSGLTALNEYAGVVVPAIGKHFLDMGKKIVDKIHHRDIQALKPEAPPPIDPRTITVR